MNKSNADLLNQYNELRRKVSGINFDFDALQLDVVRLVAAEATVRIFKKYSFDQTQAKFMIMNAAMTNVLLNVELELPFPDRTELAKKLVSVYCKNLDAAGEEMLRNAGIDPAKKNSCGCLVFFLVLPTVLYWLYMTAS